jgi:MEMO1 family protein
MRWHGGTTVGGVRPPAVAGQFYAGSADRLAAEVDGHLAAARTALGRQRAVEDGSPWQAEGLVAVVVPHAGHIYSGPTAGFAYAVVDPAAVRRVVLLGPAHHLAVDGIGTSSAHAWRTPLGEVPLDVDVAADLQAHYDAVQPADDAHGPEHSLEVQLPFLQRVLDPGWTLVPLIVGADLPEVLAEVIARCAALPGTLVVVSTDLSHYLDHQAAVARDERTIGAVLARRPEAVGPHDACGRHPLRGLLTAAARNGWDVELLDARNSGDTAGDWDRVVGYAAFAVTARAEPGPAGRVDAAARQALLGLARTTIEQSLRTGRRVRPDLPHGPPVLHRAGAAFVTLRTRSGALLGCIGSLSAHQPLAEDVVEHAYDAAFRDRRFPPMDAARARDLVIDIAVLSTPRPFPCVDWEDLCARVPVGSGVVVTAGHHRATFLPAVWEQLPEPSAFLAALWRKAGLAPGAWPAGTTVEVYDVEEFAEPGAGIPGQA